MANNTVKIIIESIYKGSGISDASKDLKNLETESASFGKNLSSAFQVSGLVLSTFAAGVVAAKKALEFGAEGAQISRLEDSFYSLANAAGSSGQDILSALDDAARGTISNSELILSANRAMMLGLGADADQLANLLEVASFRGRAMGLSTAQAFNDIVTGVGRASPMILDNLGIVIDAEQTYQDYADALGKTKEELTKAEKTQALLSRTIEEGNRQIAQAGGLVDDTAASYERLAAQSKNYFDELKKGVGEALAPFAEGLAKTFEIERETTRLMKEGLNPYEARRKAIENLNSATVQATSNLDGWGRALSDTAPALEDNTAAIQDNVEAAKALSDAYRDILSSAAAINRDNEKYAEDEAGRAAELEEIAQKKVQLQLEQNQVQAEGNLSMAKRNDFMLKQIELDKRSAEIKQDAVDAEKDLQKAANKRIFDMVQAGLSADGISTQEYQRLQDLQVQLGLVTRADADRAIQERATADEFIAAWSEQSDAVAAVADELDRIPRNSPYRAQIVIDTFGAIPSMGTGSFLNSVGISQGGLSNMPGFAEGGAFTVPGTGNYDQPYMMGLTPGETVTVTPQGESKGAEVYINVGSVRSLSDIDYIAQEVSRRLA